MTFFIQTLVINGKIFPSPLVLRSRGSEKILLLITRVCMKKVSFLCTSMLLPQHLINVFLKFKNKQNILKFS